MDKELTKSGVFFLPWIGERFSASNGTRLLILGESHYGDAKGETPDLTRNCVSQHASRTWNHRFFTMLTQVTIPRQSRGHSGCEPLKAAVRGR